MKKRYFSVLALGLLFSSGSFAQQTSQASSQVFNQDLNGDGIIQDYENTQLPVSKRVNDLLNRLSVEEKIDLLIGTGMDLGGMTADINPVVGSTDYMLPGAAGTTTPLQKYGIPAVVMTDGPGGVRISPTRANSNQTYYATCFPVAISLASSWDTQLLEKVGRAISHEALAYGSNTQLAPGMNIMRDPLCGRNYEYYSEDPILTGKLAVAMVQGLEANGVASSPKHFAANNNETNRMSINVHASQRALREIYLRPFELVVKEAQPKTIMTSYNLLNGLYTSANYDLLTTILRDEWGFRGLVMTDWYGGYAGFQSLFGKEAKGLASTQIAAGNDLLMPGLRAQKEQLLQDVENGTLAMSALDTSVRRVLHYIFDLPLMKGVSYTNQPKLKDNAELTRQAATAGMVLLKNENHTLPLASTHKNVAAFGSTSYQFIAGGIGSGYVYRSYTVSLLEGLKNAGYTVDADLEKIYQKHLNKENAKIDAINAKAAMPQALIPSELVLSKKIIKQKAKTQDIALITLGRITGEFKDRQEEGGFRLTQDELNLISNVSEAFHAQGKKVVVVLNVGGIVEVSSWQDQVDAILISWMPGQEAGNSVVDVLKGAVNPSGKLSMTIPQTYADCPSAAHFPGEPKEDPKEVSYQEGIYVGYRYFDTFEVQPAYEFGYGLSYTTFEISKLQLSHTHFHNELYLSVDVQNTGQVAGREVVQVYLSAPASEMDKPSKELKAFAKTKLLAPGETQTVFLRLTAKDLASFVPTQSAWVADQGTYQVKVGSSSKQIQQTATFELDQALVVEQVHNVLNKDADFEDLKK